MTPQEAIWDALPVGVCILNERLEALTVNVAMVKMAGGALPADMPAALTGLSEDLARALEPWVRRTLEQGRLAENVTIGVGRGDGERALLATIFPLGEDRGLAGVVLRDITEYRRFEELQRSAKRVEMIQRLAGGIAHDFNNLLTGIMANASLILEAGEDLNVEQYARDILAGSERAAELTRYMLAFSGQGSHVTDGVNLGELVRDLEPKFRSMLPERVALRIDLPPAVPPLRADPFQLADVVEILFRNALEATAPRGCGRIAIRVGTCGDWALLEVNDDGCGIETADLPRIFEPFFTTKFLGRGLGLAAVEGIVSSCGGKIQVDSQAGRGATFRVLLPPQGEVCRQMKD